MICAAHVLPLTRHDSLPTFSGEVDVIADSVFAGPLEQTKQRGAFGHTGSTSDQHDEARMRFGLAQTQEITPVAGDDHHCPAGSVAQGCAIVSGARQHFLKNFNRVAFQP
jgi:hypothetical protein